MNKRSFTVWLHTSAAPNGEDATGYLIPDWRGRIAAESGLAQYEAGSLGFRIEDKATVSSAQYWQGRIQQSTLFTLPSAFGSFKTELPYVRVYDSTDLDAQVLLFAGFVERNQLKREGDQIVGFTAVTQLSYGDRLSMASLGQVGAPNICTGTGGTGTGTTWVVSVWATGAGDYVSEGVVPGDLLYIGATPYVVSRVVDAHTVITTASVNGLSGASYVSRQNLSYYSGAAVTLVRRALRMLGNIAPNTDNSDYADVVVDPYPLGTAQTATDWTHVLRMRADAGSDPGRALPPSDFVSSVSGDRLGFICLDGKLYRVDVAPTTPGSTVKDGIALTQITVVPQGESAAVSGGYRLFAFQTADDTECLLVVQAETRLNYTRSEERILDPYLSAGASIGTLALAASKATLPTMVASGIAYGMLSDVAGNATKKVKVTPAGGTTRAIRRVHLLDIGDGTNGAGGVGGTINEQLFTSFHGTARLNYTPGDSICVARPFASQSSHVVFGRYDVSSQQTYLVDCYRAATGWTNGTTLIRFDGQPAGGMAARLVGGTRCAVAVGMTDRVELRYLGSSSDRAYVQVLDRQPARFCAALPLDSGTTVAFAMDAEATQVYVANNTSTLTRTTIAGTLPTGFKLVATDSRARTGPSATVGAPCLYRAVNAYDEQYLYAGWLYDNGGTLTLAAGTLCAQAVPGGHVAEVVPPLLWYDHNINRPAYRFLVFSTATAGHRVAYDAMMSGLWVGWFIHHDFAADPMTVRQFLEGAGRMMLAYIKLLGPAKPTVYLERKFATRWSQTVPTTGYTCGAGQLSLTPQAGIVGTEYYLAAVADCYGERVRSGSVIPGGRHTYSIQSQFLQPAQARVMGAWLIDAYPERSARYVNGRYRITGAVHLFDNSGADVTPSIEHIQRQLYFNLFAAGEITVILTGLGFTRSTGLYDAEFILYNDADVVTPVSITTPVAEDLAVVAEDTVAMPSATTTNKLVIPWHVHHNVLDTPVENPVDECVAWARTLHLPRGLNLRWYFAKYLDVGTKNHGAWFINIFLPGNGRPGVELPQTRAMVLHDGLTATGHYHELAGSSTTDTTLPPGLYWLVCVTQRLDSNSVVQAPTTWLDAGGEATEQAYYLKMGAILPGWLAAWDAVLESVTQYAPDIQPAEEV